MSRAAIALCLVARSTAAVEPGAANEAAAQTLFDDAMRLMEEKEYTRACPEFEESQRLDPGIGTQYNLADCYEKTGRTASAWALFTEVADQALKSGDPRRERVARERAEAAAQHLSHVTVRVPHPAVGLRITRDGTLLGHAMWGGAVPVDPGVHEFEGAAPGKQSWRTRILVPPDRANIELELPSLRDLPRARTDLGMPAATERRPQDTRPAAEGTWSVQRIWAVASAGLGVASIGFGVVLAVSARSAYASATCDSHNQCTAPRDVERRNDAIVRADLANVPWALGALGVGLGVTLWLTAPAPGRAHPMTGVSIAPHRISLGGRF